MQYKELIEEIYNYLVESNDCIQNDSINAEIKQAISLTQQRAYPLTYAESQRLRLLLIKLSDIYLICCDIARRESRPPEKYGHLFLYELGVSLSNKLAQSMAYSMFDKVKQN